MATLPAGVTLQQIDGGSTYYADHGFTYAVNMGWDDPNFFPIGVWNGTIDSQADVARLLDLNINTMIGIGPSYMDANTFARIQNNGISLIAEGDERASPYLSSTAPFWVGNITADEQTTFAGAFASPVSSIPNAQQDHRYLYENNNWFFILPYNNGNGSGGLAPYEPDVALRTNAPTPNGTQRHIDKTSIDMYWFSGTKANDPPHTWTLHAGGAIENLGRDMTTDEALRGSNYGDTIDIIRSLQTTYPAPITTFIENGGVAQEDTTAASYITPPEMNWAIWSTLIHGAREVTYFNHSFGGPGFSFNNLGQSYYQTIQPGQTISIYDQMKATDALIEQLAPVLNSPFAMNYVTVNGPHYTYGTIDHTLGGLEVMAKDYNGEFYIFADTRESRRIIIFPRRLPSTIPMR